MFNHVELSRLVLIGGAAARLTRLTTKDKITEPVRQWGHQRILFNREQRAAIAAGQPVTEVGAWLDTDVQDHGDGTRSVLQTWDAEACSLFVKNPTGVFLSTGPNACRHDEAKAPGTWHWPERV